MALVYKFYPKDSAIRNLKDGRLKISLIHELNDPFEFRPYRIRTSEDRRVWDNIRSGLWNNKGMISFTSNWNHPLMWAHYAQSYTGLALGIEIPDDLIFSVKYVSKRKVLPPLEEIHAKKDGKWFEDAALIKHRHWQYEAEKRIFLPKESAETLTIDTCGTNKTLYFKKFSDKMILREIIIGPECNVTSQELQAIVTPDVKIRTARLAFRSFRVVEQLNSRYFN